MKHIKTIGKTQLIPMPAATVLKALKGDKKPPVNATMSL